MRNLQITMGEPVNRAQLFAHTTMYGTLTGI